MSAVTFSVAREATVDMTEHEIEAARQGTPVVVGRDNQVESFGLGDAALSRRRLGARRLRSLWAHCLIGVRADGAGQVQIVVMDARGVDSDEHAIALAQAALDG